MADMNKEELADAVAERLQRTGLIGNNADPSSSGSLNEAVLGKLDEIVTALNKPTTMNELNPELRLIVNGVETGYRYMTLNKRERIKIPGFGEGTLLENQGRTNDGPTTFQRVDYPTIKLYMSLDDFYGAIQDKLYEAINGASKVDLRDEFKVDLREYSRPPLSPLEKEAEERFGKIGTIQADETMYVGISPETKNAMFIEQADQPKQLSFKQAQRRAQERSEETGETYCVPTAGELTKIFNNIKQGPYFTALELSDKKKPGSFLNFERRDNAGFTISNYHTNGLYRTSTEDTRFRTKVIRSDGLPVSVHKTRHHPTRLMKVVSMRP